MNTYILDTHTLIWSLFDSAKLSKSVQTIIMDKSAKKDISVATMWEIAIKSRIGKLPLPRDISGIFSDIKMNGFGILDIEHEAIEIYNTLPLLHRDPFDGIIIATAILGNLTIITTDEDIQKYDVSWVW